MSVSLRKFMREDIPHKVRWINDPENNRFLHYALPLTEEGTESWFDRVKDSPSRIDMTIIFRGVPVGILGLLQINHQNRSAELYITIGEASCKGKGIAGEAIRQLLGYAYNEMGLHRIYLLTETDNLAAVRAYEKFGFRREGCLRDELVNRYGVFVSRYVYAMLKEEYEERYGED